jgi:hypothetical protein
VTVTSERGENNERQVVDALFLSTPALFAAAMKTSELAAEGEKYCIIIIKFLPPPSPSSKRQPLISTLLLRLQVIPFLGQTP